MQVLFVISSTNIDNLIITTALEGVKKAKIPSDEINQNSILALKEKTSDVFVCDPFSGPCFEHLKQLNCRIIGAPCVLECLKKKIGIPKLNHPVFCIKMQNIVISCTNIAREERDKLHCLVKWMGGDFSKSLTSEVTHLIAGEVGSRKYHVAIDMKKQVMLPDWIYACWEDARTDFTHATDERYLKHVCPAFQGCLFCVTGFDSVEREQMKELTLCNGGNFCGELDKTKTTHLIVKDPKGTKFEFAIKWKIPCLNPLWFYDSIKFGACQSCDISHYQMKPILEKGGSPHMTSTPLSKHHHSDPNKVLPLPDISRIVSSRIVNSEISMVHDCSLDSSLSTDKMVSGTFLDGCKIYLSGFRQNEEDIYRKMISTGGGTKFNQLCDSITHVVLEVMVESDINFLLSKSLRPHVVGLSWLIKSCHEGKKLKEEPYHHVKIMKLILDNIKSKTALEFHLHNSFPNNNQLQEEKKENRLFENYIEESNKSGLFYQKTFSINGITKEQCEQLIEVVESAGGTFLGDSKEMVPVDYGIVPITGGIFTSKKVNNLVTDCWLRMCSEEGKILDIDSNDLFSPLTFSHNISTVLKGCVISISQYIGTERDYLLHIAELLGANCQEYFVRKSKNNHLPNTHLILKEPEGSKYEASLKWNIPAVSKRWLLECAKTGKLVNEDQFKLFKEFNSINKNVEPVAGKMETNLDGQTPQKFLNPNITYHPQFDLDGMMDSLQTPKDAKLNKKPSPPLEDYFTKNLQQAVKLTNNFKENKTNSSNILNGVVICVSKKLARQQTELNQTISQLGGDYKWSFDTTCTHFIADRDFDKTNNELYQVAKDKIYIVSADWLYQCKQESRHVDETAFLCYPEIDNATPIQTQVKTRSKIVSKNKNRNILSFNTSASLSTTSSIPTQKNESTFNEEDINTKEEEEMLRVTEEIEQNIKSRSDNEKIQQQFQAIMSSCKSSKNTRLVKIKRNNMGNTEEGDNKEMFIDKNGESSQQGILIGWDDPVGKEEREKIKKQLTDKEVSTVKKDEVFDGDVINQHIDTDTLTTPPIHLQITTPAMSIPEPVKKENNNGTSFKTKHPIFLLSTMSQQEKVNYSAVIEQLGGSVCDSQFYNASCTHIIVGHPTRNEKFLASVAAGKWILHQSYLEACREFGSFVGEESYEWGGPSVGLLEYPKQVSRLAQAAFRWRKKLEAKRKTLGSGDIGLFEGWKVLLHVQKNREAGFKRLLEAGNAEIISQRPPFIHFNGSTHAFIDPQMFKSSNDEINLEDLTQAEILCLKPEYIAEFIMEDPIPDAIDFLLDEVKNKGGKRMVTRSKRRAETSDTSLVDKRSR